MQCKEENFTKNKKHTKNKKKDNPKKPRRNIIRSLSQTILNILKNENINIGLYYLILHSAIVISGTLVIIFDTNLIHLIITLIVVSLDAFANVVVHECPLTVLERKYLGTSMVDERIKVFQNLNIFYTAEDSYESTFELIVNIWSIVSLKIFCIMCMRYFYSKQILNI
jgi:hypothetical protein